MRIRNHFILVLIIHARRILSCRINAKMLVADGAHDTDLMQYLLKTLNCFSLCDDELVGGVVS